MVKAKKEEKSTFSETTLNRVLAIQKGLGKPSTSREVSDILGIKDPERGRTLVRRVMAKLAEQGKVVITEAEKGRARLYSVV